MQKVILIAWCFTTAVITHPIDATADSAACANNLRLQDYGPNTLSVRKDENDSANLDFVISQMFPFYKSGCPGKQTDDTGFNWNPYFAFTGEFGFYAFGNRKSSPVIGKRFNPKVFIRHWMTGGDDYIDFGYAHESNGQSISTESAYLQKLADIQAAGERPEYASDYLSRGWDYLDFNLKKGLMPGSLLGHNHIYVNLKYFLPHGIFQGAPEEFYSWETTEGKTRSQVDGISLLFKTSGITNTEQNGWKFAAQYTTGYRNIFKYNSLRFEVTKKKKDWPGFIFWIAKGYNTDLVDYYKNLTSAGIGFEFRNFINEY